MQKPKICFYLFCLPIVLFFTSCAFHKTASQWNGLVGPAGNPVNLSSTTKVGINLLVLVPFLGNTGVDKMIDHVTSHIVEQNGDHVRIVQESSENYWYGFPPFTWFVTPVVCRVTAEYQLLKAE